MIYYLVLTVATVAVLLLCGLLWKYTHSLAFPFGVGVLYFWSLHGGWAIVTDCLGSDSRMHYHYLYDKVFPVDLDEHYTWTLALYTAFILIVELTVLLWMRPRRLEYDHPAPMTLSHDKVIVICGIAAATSLWIVGGSLSTAVQTGASGYVATRTAIDDLGWFRIHQVLNRVAIVPPAIGFATLVTSGGCRYLDGARHLRHYVGYLAVIGFMFCFCVLLGNKNEPALALFSGCLFYLANSTRPKTWKFAAWGMVLLACIGFIDYARAFSIDEIASNVSIGEVANSLTRLVSSNEAFAAHMSLYGVLAYEVPLTYGSSIYSFLTSAIPQAIWPDRPHEIYWYYAKGVNATQGQGYTIHHAAGWYLNFGVPGLLFGAFLLGRVWAALYNNLVLGTRQHGATVWRIFSVIGFYTFTAYLPTLVRTGPEGYKGVLVESLILPVVVLALSRAAPLNGLRSRLLPHGRSRRAWSASAAARCGRRRNYFARR